MRKDILRIIIGGIVYISALIINLDNYFIQLALFVISYIIVGSDVVLRAFKNILRGQVFDENFLMAIASIGAFFIGEFPEGVAVMFFYQIGELFQSYAVNKSRKSIASLMDIRPDFANVKVGDKLVKTDPDEVSIGDTIVIKAGERIPLDGKVIDGSSMIDTSALTGESVPRQVEIGSEILSGCININGLVTVEVTKEYGESTVSKILDLVENASNKKSNSERFITKFARYYTPIVVIVAVFLAIVPPLVIRTETFSEWIYRALSFLVVSCPCALVISVPLSFFGGIGGASRKGILVKGSNYLEILSKTEIIVFDKTGTLTKGVFNVQEIHSDVISKEELLELAAYAESYSNHPISLSLKRAYDKKINNQRITDVEEISGYGVVAVVDNKKITAGNIKLMETMNITYFKGEITGTVVHVAVDNVYAGYIVIADEVKSDSEKAIIDLKLSGIKQTVMLTGDNKNVANKVSKELGIDTVYSELLPGDKVEKLEELFMQKSSKVKLAFVGDGINDAPVLARADIGIAMGGLGSDAAIEAADIVIMTDEPSKIATAIKISKKTLRIAYQNIVFAISIKVLVLILSAVGLASMWAAVFADVGVTVIAIINSFRALNVKNV
ncbi:Cd2+/Zn2+-exporting ATPase [Sedimentibacter acidaminivorans]|uniref:Cd(2+)-exporting ATPase n=1 Tax=Sedimentibacter acidaminivorans TaxID=913099 RepID=A0ABS4GG30_9FIRM|nr:heavy metal translocating P-type ATPase [Sedimentibacter acidaminivorans]MBP1926597.1 Cd2+/Zn2+-exporting ATPase [Sedimentibacter acidaminivorans]